MDDVVRLKCKLSKTGQVSGYILIGVVILILVSMFIFMLNRDAPKQMLTPEVIIKNNIIACLETQLDTALKLSAIRGGPLYDFSNKFVTTSDVFEYYYVQPYLTVPVLSNISRDIDKYIYVHMDECFENNSTLYELGYDLRNVRQGRGLVKFNNDSVDYHANLSFSVTISNKTLTFEKLVARSKIPYLHMYQYAVSLAYDYYLDPQHVSYSSDIQNLRMSLFVYDQNTLLHVIRSESDNSTSFLFAARLVSNKPPVIEPVGLQYATMAQPLELQVVAKDYDDSFFEYSTSTQYAFIDSNTGNLTFTPKLPGIYFVNVSAIDSRGASSSIRFEVRVDE